MKYLSTILSVSLFFALVQCIVASPVPAKIAYPQNLKVSNPTLTNGQTQAISDIAFPEKASFQLHVDGQDLTIDVERTALLATDFTEAVLSVGEDGEIAEEVSMAQDSLSRDCYYHGKVVGDDTSTVSLDVCSGLLRGALHTRTGVYSLDKVSDYEAKSLLSNVFDGAKALLWNNKKPSIAMAMEKGVALVNLKDAHASEIGGDMTAESIFGSHTTDEVHLPGNQLASLQELIDKVVSTHEDTPTDTSTTDDANVDVTNADVTNVDATNTNVLSNDDNIPKEDNVDRRPRREKRYIEVVFFSDHERYKHLGSEVAAAGKRLFHMISSYYRNAPTKLELNIVLKGHFMFNKGDPYRPRMLRDGTTQVIGNRGLLQVFLNHMTLKQRRYPSYDVALLLSNRSFQSNIRGLANVGSVCQGTTMAGGINMVTYNNDVFNAVLTAHELGHTLGSSHDGQPGAMACPGNTHIMGPYVGPNIQFSRCSIQMFDNYLDTRTCIYNNPTAPAYGVEEKTDQPEKDYKTIPADSNTPTNDDYTIMFVWFGVVTCIGVAVAVAISSAVARKAAQRVVEEANQNTNNCHHNFNGTPQVIYVPTGPLPNTPVNMGAVYTIPQ